MQHIRKYAVASLGLIYAASSGAKVIEERLDYKLDGETYEAFVAYDDEKLRGGKAPAVLIVHDWMGPSEYSERRAREIAALGYVGMAADVYGKNHRPKDKGEAGKMAGAYKADRSKLRRHVQAALDFLRKRPQTDTKQVAAMGYCFGGTTVLELARSGADIVSAICFHGGLAADAAVKTSKIKAKVLALHGADDPNVPPAEVAAFEDEMRGAGVDWQLVAYGGAVHSFTDPRAGNDNSKGAAYNAKADARSWETMKQFLAESFKR